MRCYLKNNYSSGVSQIVVKKLPVSTKVLYLGDVFRVDEDTQEYTVTTGDVTSDGSGEATINFTPVLGASYNADIPVQLPAPRLLTDSTRTKIAAEEGTVFTYFLQFDLDEIYRITNIVTYAAGTKIKITCVGHGRITSDNITLDLPTEYAGDYAVTKIDDDNFSVDVAFDSDAPTTGTYDVAAPVRITTEAHDVTWDSKTWSAVGGMLYFRAVNESADIKQSGMEFTLSGVDPTMLSLFLSKAYCARTAKTWMGYIETNGTITCDTDKDLLFKGRMLGDFDIRETRNEGRGTSPGTIEINGRLESRLTITDTASGLQTNVDSHQQYYDGVKFFDQIPKLINKPIKWGKINTGGGKKGMCLMLVSLSASLMYAASDDSVILQPLRDYRDARMEASVARYYKEISPEILAGIDRYPCRIFVYRWIADQTIQLSCLVRQRRYQAAECLYFSNLKIMERFIA